MGKKNKYKAQQQKAAEQQKNQATALENLDKLIADAIDLKVEEELLTEKEEVAEEEVPQNVSPDDLRTALWSAMEVKKTYEKVHKKAQREMQVAQEKLNTEQRELKAEQEKWRSERKEIADLKQEKEQGFRAEREKILEDAECTRKEVQEKATAVENAQKDLDSKIKEYEASVEEFERDKQMFSKRLRAAVAEKEESLQIEKQILEKRSQAMSTYLDRLAETEQALLEAEDRIRKLEQQGDIDVLEAKNAELANENKRLHSELKRRPKTNLEPELQDAKCLNQQLEDENQSLKDENARLNAQNQRMRLSAMEIENLREEKELLETKCMIHQQAVEEIKKDLNTYLSQQQGSTVFPSCREMDNETSLNKMPELSDETLDLADFSKNLRNAFAKRQEPRYYTIEDIRCFIAGMAASNLIILQGLSGTGKTTLPRIFSDSIGADSDEKCIIPVQAGWRDRSDLIGHYNSFDKRFYETKFLKALYRAHTPRYAKKPYFIVLDEMNLSYAEQYFADFISLMEMEKKDTKKLELVTHTANSDRNVWPKHLIIDEGVSIDLPNNVWFIGTANHDETTMDFADKTYDRAHIMELPSTAQRFTVTSRVADLDDLSYEALSDAFQAAQEKYKRQALRALETLNEKFKAIFNEKFGINWGNRLEKQTKAFLPVILACGGSEAEAMDHILSSKIIRKLKNRHDNTTEDLLALQEIIETQPFGGEMSKSISMINSLLKTSL